jgi:hypothetical protein
MPNYQNSKIYKIVGNGLTYYGATTRPLSQRFSNHKTAYKCFSTTGRLKDNTKCHLCITDPNCVIILVENYPCNTKEELQAREYFYISNNECVNVNGSNGRNRQSTYKALNHEQMIGEASELHKQTGEMINRMPNYQNSKIYKIVGNGLTYYGSTITTLSQRFSYHKTAYKRFSTTGIQKQEIECHLCITDPNCVIILVENYPCNTGQELEARRHFYISNNVCVNKKWSWME